MKRRERGAAMLETALALPVILVALYGVTWGIRVGAVSERAEAAVRYAGVISAQQNPYQDYSLYALYNNLGPTSNVKTALCAPPTTLFVSGGALPLGVDVPGTAQTQAITPSFWQPDSPVQAFCDSTPERQLLTGGSRSYLLLQSVPTLATAVSDGGYFGDHHFDAAVQTAYKFYRSPDLSTLMHCADTFSTAISASLAPSKYGTAAANLDALQPGDFNAAPIALSPNCPTEPGAQTIPPTPVPTSLATGTAAPSASPGPGSSPTSQPSPSPTATAATPKPSAAPSAAVSPSAAPSAAASPTPASSPTGSSGGGGGSGGTPTPTPTGGNGGSPTPVGSPTGTPTSPATSTPATAAPTTKPVTPAPTVTPATPKPSATPTVSPTVKPTPTPVPSGPPGTVS